MMRKNDLRKSQKECLQELEDQEKEKEKEQGQGQ
jgi:hypothetical protein